MMRPSTDFLRHRAFRMTIIDCRFSIVMLARLSHGKERVWWNSNHLLKPNTPKTSWCVNWLSDKWSYDVVWRPWSSAISEHIPIYVHTYFIRLPTAGCATQKPDWNLTSLSPPCVRVWFVRLNFPYDIQAREQCAKLSGANVCEIMHASKWWQSSKKRLDQASRQLTSPFHIKMCETVIQSGSFL